MKSSSSQDIVSLFSMTPDDIIDRVQYESVQADDSLNKILAVSDCERTYANTIAPFDWLCSGSSLALLYNVVATLEMVSPQEAIRDAAHNAVLKIEQFFVDHVTMNKQLFAAIKAYDQGNAHKETLSDEQRYFIKETLEDFKRSGLDLPDEQQQQVADLKKEIGRLSLVFEKNIAQDNRTITATREQLAGLDDTFITGLSQNDTGEFVLGIDYPTYHAVAEQCVVADTRKRLYQAFSNRAYPVNESVLEQIIAKRDELAKLLGYQSYAEFDLDSSMAGSTTRAYQFINELLVKASRKAEQEMQVLLEQLPDSVTLTADGKLRPWDSAYIKAQYKKNHLAVDEQKIAEYFPMESTINGLLGIYQQFLGVDFKEALIGDMWHEDVRLIQVCKKGSDVVLGNLLLDLHPRPNKYSHACHITLVPSVTNTTGPDAPSLSLVIANFAKPTDEKPSLLHRSREVQTFFHEFGHALHAILGRTQMASFAGTSVKRDFVEMPSQMLEEWLNDKVILKSVSKHYQTGEPLSDDLIDKIQALQHFDSGLFVERQLLFSLLSLDYYAPGADKDVHGSMAALYNKHVPHTAFDPENHFYASFGHLTGYGAQYYGYMWSKVYALDLFYEIKKHGLLNPIIGRRYVDQVIGKGGSQHPQQLLTTFLGREPQQDAFLKDLGLATVDTVVPVRLQEQQESSAS